jgi:hypothetical protein
LALIGKARLGRSVLLIAPTDLATRRVAEIATGTRFGEVSAAHADPLPRPGPYPKVREAVAAIAAMALAKEALAAAEATIRRYHDEPALSRIAAARMHSARKK